MRASSGHLGQVRFERLECVVFGSAKKGGEFSLVDAVVIHLLVMEPGRADELVRLEVREELCTQASISSQWPVLGKPLGKCSGAEVQAEAFLDVCGDVVTRIAAIIAHEC